MVNLINQSKEWCRIRNTELHVVLVQERNAARGTTTNNSAASNNSATNFFDPSSDRVLLEIAGERVTGLRRKIGFDGNGVTLLYTGDIASPGSPLVAALDNVLRERSTIYYQNQTKRIKKLLTRCTLPIQTHYRVRLLFKLAYFQEFRGRPHKALKYYSQAYSALASIIPSLSTSSPFIKAELFGNILPQLKTIADFINFKIMHAYLSSGNAPVTTPTGVTGLTGAQAATMQFSNHIRTFESVIGTASVTNPFPTCTHYAWLSKQYVTAAELLQLNLPRPTLETRPQHIPCYYYHTAGLYAIRRRKAAETLSLLRSYSVDTRWNSDTSNSSNDTSSASPSSYSPLTEAAILAQKEAENWTILPSVYIGGMPVLQKKPDADMSTSHRDENAALMAIICAEESSFNHSEQIVSLFERAQAMAVVDGGTGSNMVVPASSTSGSSTDASFVTSFNRGSMFSYYPGTDASHSRFWRQWLIAEELFVSQGKLEQTARLLAPIAANCRRDQWWPILARIALRVRECAVGLRDKGLYIAASLDLLTAALSCAVPKIDDIFVSLAQTIQSSSSSLSSSPTNHYDIHLPPPKPLALNPSLSEFGSGNESPLSLQPFPLPSHLNASMKYAGAPLLCSTVVFSRRLVQRGDTVTVRVITTSNLPKSITLDSLQIRFRGVVGDALLRAEIGIGSNILHSNTDDTRAFDIILVHMGTKEAEQAIATATAADNDGICHIDLSNHPITTATTSPMIVKSSLVLPARGSLCFQYVLRSPVSSKLPLNSSKADLVQSLHSSVHPDTLHIATTDSVLTAQRSTTANNQTSSTVDRHSTNPFALAAVAGNVTSTGPAPSSATITPPPTIPIEMEPGLDTIICEKVIINWSGISEALSSGVKGDTVSVHLYPRLLAPSNGDMRNVWLQPIVHQNTFPVVRITNRLSTAIKKSTLLSIYEGQYLESLTSSQTKDILLALGTVLESCVAHMARTGATRTLDQHFSPRNAKAINWGYTEGKLPDDIIPSLTASDAGSSLNDNDLKGLQQILQTITKEGKYERLSSSLIESKTEIQHTGTIVYGEDENVYAPMNSTAMAGRLIHYHNVLILRPPVAQCEVMIDRPVKTDESSSTASIDIQQRPCAMGGKNPLQIHVRNNGKKAITGGVLFLSPVQLLHRTALVHTEGNNTNDKNTSNEDKGINPNNTSSFAEVDITVPTDATDGGLSTDNANMVTNNQVTASSTSMQDNQRIKRAEEALVKMMKILLPSQMLIITKDGKVTEAGKFVTATNSTTNGEASATMDAGNGSSKKDKKKKKGDNTTVNVSNGTTVPSLPSSSSDFVPLSLESGIIGIAIPALPTNIDYSCTIQLQTPSLLQLIQFIDSSVTDKKGITLHDYNLFHRLRCGIAGNFYAFPAVNETMLNFNKPDEWIDLAARNPHSLVVTRSIVPVDIANPLYITCDIQPNVNYPLLDTAPITRYSTPFSTISSNLLSRIGSASTENISTVTTSGSSNVFIQKGTDFVSRLSIVANTCENIYVTKVSLLPNDTDTNCKTIQVIEDNLQRQLVDLTKVNTDNAVNSNSSIMSLLNLQKADNLVSNGTLIRSGQVLHSSLRYSANEIGNESLGCIQATVKVGTIDSPEHIIQIPLPMVTIGSSPIRCDVVWPEVATVRNAVQLSVRITNNTPHFQALEVALQPPAVAWAKGNSTGVTAAHVEALQGLQVFEPMDRFTRYIVELLPNASKGVSFNLIAGNPGFTILPSIVVKGTRTEGRPEAKIGPMANIFTSIGNPNAGTATASSTASVSLPVAVRPPNPTVSTALTTDVLTVVPVGSDGVPAPRGIYVSAN